MNGTKGKNCDEGKKEIKQKIKKEFKFVKYKKLAIIATGDLNTLFQIGLFFLGEDNTLCKDYGRDDIVNFEDCKTALNFFDNNNFYLPNTDHSYKFPKGCVMSYENTMTFNNNKDMTLQAPRKGNRPICF